LAHGPKLVDEQGKCRIKVSRDLYLPQPLDDALAVDQPAVVVDVLGLDVSVLGLDMDYALFPAPSPARGSCRPNLSEVREATASSHVSPSTPTQP
jgi:hypothetical protein